MQAGGSLYRESTTLYTCFSFAENPSDHEVQDGEQPGNYCVFLLLYFFLISLTNNGQLHCLPILLLLF